MKRVYGFLFSVIALCAMIIACEGPEGKQGPAGPAGKDGTDAEMTCTQCHGQENYNHITAQYDLSQHNKGIIFEEEAGRINCGGCHTGDGFIEAVTTGKDDPTTKATSKINCETCHPIHTSFTSADFALRVKDAVKLRKGGDVVDFKLGNTCARCHQARSFVDYASDTTLSPASASASYSRYGPHYGTPANIVAMKGLYNIEGSTPIPTSNVHGNASKGCVTCHMGADASNPATGGHSFQMNAASLAKITECNSTCHAGNATIFTTTPFGKSVDSLLKVYRKLLITKGILDTSQAISASGYNVLGEYLKARVKFTQKDIQVAVNYLYLAKDRSHGIHNPRYVMALVKNGIEHLEK